MSKRICPIHGVWEKTINKQGCPKCHKRNQKTYDKFSRDKDSTKFYRSKEWQSIRSIILGSEPLCRKCIRSIASHVDHIIPISEGGCLKCLDNLQPLCPSCHTKKTNTERLIHRPYWIPKPLINVVIVAGPSGSGKTLFCENNKDDKTIIIDLDVIKVDLTKQKIYQWGKDEKHRESILERNRILANLSNPKIIEKYDRALFILSAPKKETREFWAETLNAKVILLMASREVCINRIRNDERRNNRLEYFTDVVNKWFEDYSSSRIDTKVETREGVLKSLDSIDLLTRAPI